MGNRALVQVVNSDSEFSPVLYLHWQGGCAPAYIEQLKTMMADRNDDCAYTFARLVGIAHTAIEPPLSVGVWNADAKLTAADSHGDSGVYIVHCYDNWEVEHLL